MTSVGRFRFGPIIASGILALTLAACSSSEQSTDGSQNTTQSSTTFSVGGINWAACPDTAPESLVQCGNLEVPFDYDNPDEGSFVLYIKRRQATVPSERIGSMLVNPGGPGFGGSSLADDAAYYFSESLLNRFDIIGWDPRGTGLTTPAVDCVDSFDEYVGLDSPPDTPEEKQALIDASQAFNDKCEENAGTILPYISTRASAADMNSIRLALGEEKITYFGFSYGSELGATWATMYPNTVRAAVLDGAVDPLSTSTEEGMAQAGGFEKQLTAFLAQCSKKPTCEFHNDGNSEDAIDALLLDLDANPLVVSATRTPVTQGVAFTAIAQAMYSDSYWPQLQSALADAQRGDGAGLLALYDDYYQRKSDGSYGNELEAFLAISCLDDPGASSIEEVDASVGAFIAVAPRLGANFAHGYSCVLWPVKQAEKVVISGKGAGPIVVVGTTGDAATPLSSTRNMAKALESGVL
ncbi:MAG: alpha/beta fold hydrolase, partial [Actinobacteria bacterium]|nr:alpha/beta fold hydrolase [Actinomycetota bacterium]